MRKWLSKWVCAGMVLTMTFGLTACGGTKQTSGDSTLAKQYVYSYEGIEIPDMGDDISIRGMSQYDGRIYLVMQVYHWEGENQENDIRIVSMNTDGTDMKAVQMEIPNAESDTDTEMGNVSEEEASVSEITNDTSDISEDAEDVIASDDFIMDDMALDDEDYTGYYEYIGYSNYTVSPDGRVYAVKEYYYEDYSDPENYVSKSESSICAWDMEGAIQWQSAVIENLQIEDSYCYISALVPKQNGLNIIIRGDEVSKIEVDAEGNLSERKSLPNGGELFDNTNDIIPQTDGTVLVSYYNDDWTKMFVVEYDINTDAVGEEITLPDSVIWNGYNTMAAGISTDLVYTNSSGVFGYSAGDEEPVQIMSFINSDLDTNNMQQIFMLDDSHFVAFYYDSVDYETRGAVFTKRNPEDIPDKKVLVLGSIYVDYQLKSRIVDFNRQNEEYRIVVKEYNSYNSMDDYNAGATQLNNDIISGNMPDILIVDSSLPMQSYISKGLLADVGQLIEEDEELSQIEYMENVFNAYSVDDKLYYVIPNFYVRTFVGKTALLGDKTSWNMEQFQNFTKTLSEDTEVIGELTRDDFMSQMINYCGSDFVNEASGQCNFDSAEFIGMLEFANTLPTELSEDYYGDDYWMNYESQYRDDRTLLMNLYISNASNVRYSVNGYFGEEVTYIGAPTDSGNGAVLAANDSMYALSAKLENIDGAWEFVRYYLTEECQSQMEWGLPVAKQVFLDKMQDTMRKPYYEDEDGNEVEYDDYIEINGESIVIEPFSQEQYEQLVDVIMLAEKKTYYNEDVTNIINEETAAFFEGQKSAAEVASIIQSRVQIFVDENR